MTVIFGNSLPPYLGLKEDQRGTDREKFLDVVETIGVQPDSVKIESMVRLGTRDENEQQKTRPMKTWRRTTQKDHPSC